MKFTFSWLQKFLKTKRSLKDICEKLTLLGIEVREIIDNQDVLKPFKIAQVVDVKDHPNADRLKLCKINDGNKTSLSYLERISFIWYLRIISIILLLMIFFYMYYFERINFEKIIQSSFSSYTT